MTSKHRWLKAIRFLCAAMIISFSLNSAVGEHILPVNVIMVMGPNPQIIDNVTAIWEADHYAKLMQLKPRITRNENGRVPSITADNISDYSLAKLLGPRDGDILQAINGESIDSQRHLLELVNEHRATHSYRISITREDGSSSVNVITLQ